MEDKLSIQRERDDLISKLSISQNQWRPQSPPIPKSAPRVLLWSSALSLDERFKSELGIEWESRATLDAATPRQHGLDVGPHRGLLLTVPWRRSRAGLAVLQ